MMSKHISTDIISIVLAQLNWVNSHLILIALGQFPLDIDGLGQQFQLESQDDNTGNYSYIERL